MYKILQFVLVISAAAFLACSSEFGIERIDPAIGVISGGEPIDLLGTGFSPDMGITVYFGNIKADNVVVHSSTKMTVNTPSAAGEGKVDVRVITDHSKEYLLPKAFTYVKQSNMDIRDLGKRKSLREQ